LNSAGSNSTVKPASSQSDFSVALDKNSFESDYCIFNGNFFGTPNVVI